MTSFEPWFQLNNLEYLKFILFFREIRLISAAGLMLIVIFMPWGGLMSVETLFYQ